MLAMAASIAHAQIAMDQEPDLAKVDLPILAAAREHPEALWAFLIDPTTPYTDAMAAATRGAEVFPLRLVRRLLLARTDLHREFRLHYCGFQPPKDWSLPMVAAEPPQPERRLLGRTWTLPKERTPYPTTWAEAAAAPWPWRTQQILDRCWDGLARRHSTQGIVDAGGLPQWLARVEAWYTECLTWNTDDDESAAVFFEATQNPVHTKSLPLLARWRRILLDPRTPQTAAQIANCLGESHRLQLYGDPATRLACEILLADGLRQSTNLQARFGCAYQLGRFTEVCDQHMVTTKVPCPPEALLAAGDLGAAPPPADLSGSWTQLYAYAYSVCEAVPDPPFVPDRGLSMQRHDIPGELAKFAAWWPAQRPAVEKQVQARAAELDKLRKRLEQLAQ